MTSEVVVMNRLAVAMAADSAVTVGNGQKIYPSAMKLFTLSKYHPVGVMIFNAATILGYPWETIIKVYRQQLGTGSFPRVVDYAEDFRRYLHANERGLFNKDLQEKVVLAAAYEYLEQIANDARSRFFSSEPDQIDEALLHVLGADKTAVESKPLMKCFPEDIEQQINDAYGAAIVKAAADHFKQTLSAFVFGGRVPDFKAAAEQAATIVGMKLARETQFGNYSGVVIAGFGESEFLPSMTSVLVGGVVCDCLKWDEPQCASVTADGGPVIKPFAQSQMANTFMSGIDPSLKFFMALSSIKMVRRAVELAIDAIDDIPAANKQKWKDETRKPVTGAWREYQANLAEHISREHESPLQQVISSLPKDELAEVAESMVSLNALKLKVSNAKETVGGPIDVAVITKGDGFIWIKRKHYFKPELNPQFAANYYRPNTGEALDEPAA